MNPYEDMLRLPRHRSPKRAQMTQLDRAAQFAPFSALNGYGEAIDETARLTQAPVELMEGAAEQIDEALRHLRQEIHCQPEVTVTYFVPDSRKSGGAYRTVTGHAKKLSEHEGILLLTDGTKIPIHRIWLCAVL